VLDFAQNVMNIFV